ncbi:serine/threonine protein kinase [Roseomonas populi]|uniref:Protein kinase n=1 Tax=Roseomonas populi TaxID=3121582 RepID=A0ABT1XBZ4_9PROT|nr:protein kinase [Roseomonas pecuniae]MCR0985656.1 protein kinase [Roseomonas pecuniae]
MRLYDVPEELKRRIISMHLQRYGELEGEPEMGAFGEIYKLKATLPLVAKCPQLKKFGTDEGYERAIGKLLVEFEKVGLYWRHHGVQRYNGIEIIYGWPFLLSRLRHETLADRIADAASWTMTDKLLCLVQVCRALSYCQRQGLTAHQDLKPANIFVDDLSRHFRNSGSSAVIVRYKTYVADFGLADAFREFGKNSGSRPYMAPEQYHSGSIDNGSAIDIFALAVMSFECLSDGTHPIGEKTSEVWPVQLSGKSSKWKRENVWKDWARRSEKAFPDASIAAKIPAAVLYEIKKALSPNPDDRPTIEQFEYSLWCALEREAGDLAQSYRTLIDVMDEHYTASDDSDWPYLTDCISRLRRLYSIRDQNPQKAQ